MSPLWLTKTYIFLHWRTPSIPKSRGRISSQEILADIIIRNLFWEKPTRATKRDLVQPYKWHPQQCRDPFRWQSSRQPWLRWQLLSTSEQNLCRGTSFTSAFRSASKCDWRQVLFFKISCSGYNSFVHILKFSYRVKDFFKSLPWPALWIILIVRFLMTCVGR